MNTHGNTGNSYAKKVDTLDCRLTIRIKNEEKEEWAKQAAKAGISLGNYVRAKINQPAKN